MFGKAQQLICGCSRQKFVAWLSWSHEGMRDGSWQLLTQITLHQQGRVQGLGCTPSEIRGWALGPARSQLELTIFPANPNFPGRAALRLFKQETRFLLTLLPGIPQGLPGGRAGAVLVAGHGGQAAESGRLQTCLSQCDSPCGFLQKSPLCSCSDLPLPRE